MKYISIIIFSLLLIGSSCKPNKPNNSENCEIKKIKYLSTYTNSRMWKLISGEGKIDLNSIKEFSLMKKSELKSAYFFIPVLIVEIEKLYSNSILDGDEKEILVELSIVLSTIFDDDSMKISIKDSKKNICKKINSIINSYHIQSEDDTKFFKMIYTLDDGPFQGLDSNIKLKPLDSIEFKGNRLLIRGNNFENTLELIDKSGKIKWRKIIARSEDYKISNLEFSEKPIRVENELGYKIALHGGGELIQLYLRKNGDFRLFFHSW